MTPEEWAEHNPVRPGRWKLGPRSSRAWQGISEQRQFAPTRAERRAYDQLCELEARWGPAHGAGGRWGAAALLLAMAATWLLALPLLEIAAGGLLMLTGLVLLVAPRPRRHPLLTGLLAGFGLGWFINGRRKRPRW